jgi:cation transport ATPase
MTLAECIDDDPSVRLLKPTAALFDDKANALWSMTLIAAMWAAILAWQAFRQSAFGSVRRTLTFSLVMAASCALVLWWRFGP